MPDSSTRTPPLRKRSGFTLVELMLSMAIFAIIIVALASIIGQAQQTYLTVNRTADQFRSARLAFELMTSRLEQATLNTFWDYDDLDKPTKYVRQSDLHFVSGPVADIVTEGDSVLHAVFFQAPIGLTETRGTPEDPYEGMETLLNSWGYYLDFGSDKERWPPFLRGIDGINDNPRWRLMEFRRPSEDLGIYGLRLRPQQDRDTLNSWINKDLAANSQPIADNIVALVIQPRKFAREDDQSAGIEIAPNFLYDSREFEWGSVGGDRFSRVGQSRNQLPPMLDVIMVAVAEASIGRLERSQGADAMKDVIPEGLFEDSRDLEEDVRTMEDALEKAKLDYEIFSNTILIRGAKWSS